MSGEEEQAMAGKTVLILGGGFGGLTAAQHLRRFLPREHRIAVVEKKDSFYMCASNMRLITGEMEHPQEGERALSELSVKGIDWVHAEVDKIDSEKKRVQTSTGTLEGDYIIIALGAEKLPDKIHGFAESAYDLSDAFGSLQLRKALDEFESGRVIGLVCSVPYSCPGAPCEAALLAGAICLGKNIRQSVEVAIYTPEPRPLAAAGEEMGRAVLGMLQEHNIEYHSKQKVQRIESNARKLIFEEGEVSFDLLIGVPPHAPPRAVREAGLTDETGWIPVDLQTLETPFPGIFAIGDITSIRQPNPTGLFLPKAGVFADEQARVVARNISGEILGEAKRGGFDGRGFCYLEMGDGTAAYGSGNFYAYPAPRVYLESPSRQFHKERSELEREQLEALV
jgi:sulfide:quinone oxidoreductase